jgi:hypothetical protein
MRHGRNAARGDRLNLVKIAEKYADDERIDPRVREKNIKPMLQRLNALPNLQHGKLTNA